MSIEVSCGLPPGPQFSDLAAVAEDLGYSRVWIFDTASLWEDPFVHLALAAQRTSRIEFGTAVLIPVERSVMSMAAAVATLARLSGGRFRACFGTGASARRTMGQPPMTLNALRDYVTALRGLLAGETVLVDGKPARMLHADGLAVPRPIEVEIWLSVFGPRGVALASDIADGIITGGPTDVSLPVAMLMPATVLEPEEDPDSARVREAVGPWKVVRYHETYAIAGPEAVDALPGGRRWRQAVEEIAPEGERHLYSHQGHVTHLTDRDRQLLNDAPDGLATIGSPEEIGARVDDLARRGIREVIYTPSGSDIARELSTFYAAASK